MQRKSLIGYQRQEQRARSRTVTAPRAHPSACSCLNFHYCESFQPSFFLLSSFVSSSSSFPAKSGTRGAGKRKRELSSLSLSLSLSPSPPLLSGIAPFFLSSSSMPLPPHSLAHYLTRAPQLRRQSRRKPIMVKGC